jgi:radical SAM-linked protein
MDPDDQPSQPVQRLRLTFSKAGPARYISHLDLARALERALNRAALPVAYSQGFNRRPRLALAAALPLGYTSEMELADVWLIRPLPPRTFQEQLMANMAPGITVQSVIEVPLSGPSLQQLLAESTYLVRFPDPVDGTRLQTNVEALLAAETLVRQRIRPRESRPRSFDLRPLILDAHVTAGEDGSPQLYLRLVQTATQTGRPEDVLAELGFDPLDAWVHRVGLQLNESPSPTE